MNKYLREILSRRSTILGPKRIEELIASSFITRKVHFVFNNLKISWKFLNSGQYLGFWALRLLTIENSFFGTVVIIYSRLKH